MAYNGSGIIAMTGKNCVAIASDMRFGIQQQTMACDFDKVHDTTRKYAQQRMKG
jgi:20S proteasome subunit beta 3